MAITLVAHTGAQSTDSNSVATSAIDTTGANFLFLTIGSVSGSPNTPTDNKGNTWIPLTLRVVNASCACWYAANAIVGSGHTFSYSQAATSPVLVVAAFSGLATSPFDVESGGGGSGTTAQASSSVSPGVNNELVISAECFISAGSMSIDSSFIITDSFSLTANSFGGGIAYLIQTAATPVNPTWTDTVGAAWATELASFKPAPPSGVFVSGATQFQGMRLTYIRGYSS